MTKIMQKIILHVCCAPCSTHSIEELQKDYEVTLFFYNPCIFPEKEYNKRLENAEIIAKEMNVKLIAPKYNHQEFIDFIKGLENEKENGARCLKCFEQRLSKTAEYASEHGFDFFTTTLTISPHKNSKKIFEIAENKKGNSKFLEIDFKKKDGFKKSTELSKKYNLYRQNYCGCEFSLRSSIASPKEKNL